MADTELREKIVIDGAEAGAAKLHGLAQAAGRVAGAFSHIGELASIAGGIAGLWKVGETIHEVDQLYQAIIRVQDITGIAAENAHALFDVFEQGGIGMEAAERIITSMTQKGAKLADGMAGVGVQAQNVTGLMHRLGISVKSGPEERILAMSKAAQAGKLDVAQLVSAFAIPRTQAAAMMSLLKQGPERLKQIQQDTLTGADVIDDRTIESYKTMLQVRRELGDAWGDLVNTFYKNLIPAITEVLKQVKAGFDAIQPIASAIGSVLRDHMTAVVALAKTFLALTIANKAVNLVTGGDTGVFGRGKQVIGGLAGFLTKGQRAGAAADYFEARGAAPGIGMFEKAGGGVLSSALASIKGLGGVFSGLGGVVRTVVSVFTRLAPVGLLITAMIAVIAGAFMLLRDNTLGIRDAFAKVFKNIWAAIGGVIEKLGAVFGLLWLALKPVVLVLGGALLAGLWLIAKVIEFVADTINLVMEGIVALINGVIWLVNQLPGVSLDYLDVEDAREKASAGQQSADKQKAGAGVYQDFRGSKFDIQQNFPEGIDERRVAVAFADNLARLGERRLDSGLRPLYSIR